MATQNAKTNTFENMVLNWALTANAVTRPTTWYIALFKADPTDTATVTQEVTGGGYARQTVAFTVTGNQAVNTGEVNFGQASASWGTVTHWAVMTASTGGTMLYYGATEDAGGTNTGFTVNNGDTFKFPASTITITEE